MQLLLADVIYETIVADRLAESRAIGIESSFDSRTEVSEE
jgi:hypothetical protein